MTHYKITKTEVAYLAALKHEYLQQCISPLDGMWEHFVGLADHYAIACDDTVIGYCAVNAEQKLLQFYIIGAHDAAFILSQLISELKISGAFLASSEMHALAVCMDHQVSVTVNALMYHTAPDTAAPKASFPNGAQFKSIAAVQLQDAVEFVYETLGMDIDWLKGYLADLIAKGELFGLWLDHKLIATGERRVSASQTPFADVGMIVGTNHRGKGLATNMLVQLRQLCEEEGRKAICSTERDNVAAQKAISRAGFVSHQRILEFTF